MSTSATALLLLPACLLMAAVPARATDFQLTPVQLPGGFSLTGTVSTDGSIGPLTAANLTGWRVTVRSSTLYRYSPADPGGAQVSGVTVSADGRRMTVKASPDRVRDGGILAFGAFGPGPEYGVQIANFTGYWGSNGGVAFYLAGAAFEWDWFDAVNGSHRLVAKAPPGSAQFRLLPVVFASGATLSGHITTDGRTGALGPANIVDWQIVAKVVNDTVHYKDASGSNSQLLPGSGGLSTDGRTLSVARPGGLLAFGVPPAPPRRGAAAVLADFTSAAPAGGRSGYFDAFGSQYKPLQFSGSAWPVATALP